MLRQLQRTAAAFIALLAVSFGLTISPAPASAATAYPIAWTQIGIYPRFEPDMDSARAAGLLRNGDTISIACEVTNGKPVSNGAQTLTVWEKLHGGGWIPNAFVNTGVDGRTPGVPLCDMGTYPDTDRKAPKADSDKIPEFFSGEYLSANDPVAWKLYRHYVNGTGKTVVIDWRYFSRNSSFVKEAKNIAAGSKGGYKPTALRDGDMYWAIGRFDVYRLSTDCYRIEDQYDFTTDKNRWTNLPFKPLDDLRNEGAAIFNVRSSGCL